MSGISNEDDGDNGKTAGFRALSVPERTTKTMTTMTTTTLVTVRRHRQSSFLNRIAATTSAMTATRSWNSSCDGRRGVPVRTTRVDWWTGVYGVEVVASRRNSGWYLVAAVLKNP
ncbi:unnamed protein product [Ectocarpus sp. 6 AP-2014]